MEKPRFVYIHQLRHSWFVTILWLSCVMLLGASSTWFCVDMCFHFSRVYAGVELLGPVVTLCSWLRSRTSESNSDSSVSFPRPCPSVLDVCSSESQTGRFCQARHCHRDCVLGRLPSGSRYSPQLGCSHRAVSSHIHFFETHHF